MFSAHLRARTETIESDGSVRTRRLAECRRGPEVIVSGRSLSETPLFNLDEGMAVPSGDEPGLGVRIAEAALERFRVRP